MRKQISSKTNESSNNAHTHTHTHMSIKNSFATKSIWFARFHLQRFHSHCDVKELRGNKLGAKNFELNEHLYTMFWNNGSVPVKTPKCTRIDTTKVKSKKQKKKGKTSKRKN